MKRPTAVPSHRYWSALWRVGWKLGKSCTVATTAGTRAATAPTRPNLQASGQVSCAWKTAGRRRRSARTNPGRTSRSREPVGHARHDDALDRELVGALEQRAVIAVGVMDEHDAPAAWVETGRERQQHLLGPAEADGVGEQPHLRG